MISVNIRQNIAELQTQFAVEKKAMEAQIRAGMRAAKAPLRSALQAQMRTDFRVKQDRFLRTWVISASTGKIIITNRMQGFGLHAMGGIIGPRSGSAVLIPINTAAGTRIGAKKFYKLIDWIRREKLGVVRNGILYVRPVMNTSRRGGVGIGKRINKKFRARFSGSFKRPSGFDIKLNEQGLTPIAIVRRSITMRKRFDMSALVQRRLVPIVLQAIELQARR